MPDHRPRLADRRRSTHDRARLGVRLVTWPGGVFVVGLLLGAGTHVLDTRLPWTVLHVTQASYRSLLTALVAGIITAAVFSIWMRSVLAGSCPRTCHRGSWPPTSTTGTSSASSAS